MEHVIFDFDGVIADSFHFHLGKINEWYGLNISEAEYRDAHDGNFYDNKLDKLANIDFKQYAKRVATEQGLLPMKTAAYELLVNLSKTKTLHLVTSGREIQVRPFLENHKIKDLFSSTWFADEGASKSEKLIKLMNTYDTDASECVFITDTLGDVREANELEMQVVGVTFGYHDRTRLCQDGELPIMDSWSELEKWLEVNT